MTLRPNDYDRSGDIIPDSMREETQGDLISREALKKKFERLVDETIPYGGVAVNDMRELIDNAPTVEAFTEEYVSGAYNEGYMCGNKEAEKARPQGEWYRTGQSFINPNKFRNYGCSVCHYELDEHIREKLNYCPNCGADMRKGGPEE